VVLVHNIQVYATELPSKECVYILIHIQQDARLRSLFYLKTALHVSDGISAHNQESKQLYLHHLVFVTPLLLPAAIVEELELVCVCSQHTQTCFNSSTIAADG
jgi:hypothetical protein